MNDESNPPAHQLGPIAFSGVAEIWAHGVLANEDPQFTYTKEIFERTEDGLRLPDGSLVRRGEWVLRIGDAWRRSLDGSTPAGATAERGEEKPK
jgi:hypothetical protein